MLAALLAAVSVFAAAQTPPAAVPAAPAPAPASAKSEPPGQPVEFKTPDNWTIRGVYSPAKEGGKTFVLLPGKTRTKEEWRYLARLLAKAGYGYLAIDTRGHGDSETGPDGRPFPWHDFKATRAENEWADMRLDAQAAVGYLTGQGVPEDTIGLIGDDIGGIIALQYAAVHPKVPMVVMISPAMQYLDVPSYNAMRAYKDRPILMLYSDLDRTATRDMPLLYGTAQRSAGADKAYAVGYPNVHGYRLAVSGPALRQIVSWIENPVTPPPPAASTEAVSGSSMSAPGEEAAPGVNPQAAPDSGAGPDQAPDQSPDQGPGPGPDQGGVQVQP